jgi:hypothetical protein
MISQIWCKTAISAFYGFAVYPEALDPYYAMQEVIGYGLDEHGYATLSTFCPAVF